MDHSLRVEIVETFEYFGDIGGAELFVESSKGFERLYQTAILDIPIL